MPLINTAGLTIIGDGSQWFWAMAGFFAIPVTGYAIYSQLQAQRSANRVNVFFALRAEWRIEHLRRSSLAVLMQHVSGKPGWPPTLAPVGAFFERLAILVKRGDVNAEGKHWEAMAQAMAEITRRRGYPLFDLALARAALPVSIFDLIQLLRIEEESKAGVVPPWSGDVPSWSPPEASEA